jgi:hypothetical protein
VTYLWFIPFLTAVAGAARFWDDHNAIKQIGLYIRKREALLDPTELGWESSHEHDTRAKYKRLRAWDIRKASWFILIAGTFVISFLLR